MALRSIAVQSIDSDADDWVAMQLPLNQHVSHLTLAQFLRERQEQEKGKLQFPQKRCVFVKCKFEAANLNMEAAISR